LLEFAISHIFERCNSKVNQVIVFTVYSIYSSFSKKHVFSVIFFKNSHQHINPMLVIFNFNIITGQKKNFFFFICLGKKEKKFVSELYYKHIDFVSRQGATPPPPTHLEGIFYIFRTEGFTTSFHCPTTALQQNTEIDIGKEWLDKTNTKCSDISHISEE
jgi:hypothetical protein